MKNHNWVSEEKIDEIQMGMNLVKGDEYRETLAGISASVSDVLVKTLGPYAATTTIDDGTFTYPTKDGWSVLNRLRFADVIHETLFKFIKQISFALNSKVGDGTTTAVVAANHFAYWLMQLMSGAKDDPRMAHLRQADLLDYVDDCSNALIEELHDESRLHKVETPEDVYKIAYVSTNRNDTISRFISDIYEKTNNPNIHVTLGGDGNEPYYEIQNGYKLDAKLLFSRCYVNTEDKTYCITDDAEVFIFDHNVTYSDHYSIVNAIIAYAARAKRTAVIIAPYFDEVITSILGSSIKKCFNEGQIANVAFVQVPLSTSLQQKCLDDLAVLVNTQLFSYSKVRMFTQLAKQSEHPEDMKDYDEYKDLIKANGFTEPSEIINMCRGISYRITLSDKYLLLEDFSTTSNTYTARYAEVKEEYEVAKAKADKSSSTLNKEYMNAHMRYVKFSGSTGIIHVCGESDLVKQCLKDSVDDAVLACRSAYENGYIRGLNIETISAAEDLENAAETASFELGDQRDSDDAYIRSKIFGIIAKAFRDTTHDVMSNKYNNDYYFQCSDEEYLWGSDKTDSVTADISGELTMDEVIDKCVEEDLCYDIVTEKFETAGESVINSVSTDCEIISAVTSILSLLLSSNQLLSINKIYDSKRRIQDLKEKSEEASAFAEGVVSALKESKCVLFPSPEPSEVNMTLFTAEDDDSITD